MGYKASQPTGRESGWTDFASSGHGKSLPLPAAGLSPTRICSAPSSPFKNLTRTRRVLPGHDHRAKRRADASASAAGLSPSHPLPGRFG